MASSSAEEGYHLGIALLPCQARRGVARTVLQGGISAVGYQQPDDVVPAEKRGHHEGGLTDIIGRVDVAVLVEQPIRDLAVALSCNFKG
jgi:hypothetical protein